MEFDIVIQYSTEEYLWLCFRHAVILAFKGEDVDAKVTSSGSEDYEWLTICDLCVAEREQKEKQDKFLKTMQMSNTATTNKHRDKND
jgi:hypothetical protein